MQLNKRSYRKELLDSDDIPCEDIRRNMRELDVINRLLGGHAITMTGFRALLGHKKAITICEIGCGGGDNLAAIVKWCHKHEVSVHCIGIDIKKACIDMANENQWLKGITSWRLCDFKDARFGTKPDIIFSSLFCHHFTDEQLADQLQWMKENCSDGFFINDLQRHTVAYHSIKILTWLFSRSYLVKNDAPLSVTRGFVRKEWVTICERAKLGTFHIQWKWAFRYLVTFKK